MLRVRERSFGYKLQLTPSGVSGVHESGNDRFGGVLRNWKTPTGIKNEYSENTNVAFIIVPTTNP